MIKISDFRIVYISDKKCILHYKNSSKWTLPVRDTKSPFIKKIFFKNYILLYAVTTKRIYKIIKRWL